MIRRKWVIYDRRSRQIVSSIYSRRKDVLSDLARLNSYCGKKKYAMQLRRFDTEQECVVSHYPRVDLKELPKQEVDYG
jgi:hypothetical protein